MRYSDKLHFGIFQGRSIISVFTGSISFSKELISEIIRMDFPESKVSDGYIEIIDDNELAKHLIEGYTINFGDLSTVKMESEWYKLLSSGNAYRKQFWNEEFYQSKRLFIGQVMARPSYIEWCILQRNGFCVNEVDLLFLESLECYNICEVVLKKISGNMAALIPNYKTFKFTFSKKAKEINRAKIKKA